MWTAIRDSCRQIASAPHYANPLPMREEQDYPKSAERVMLEKRDLAFRMLEPHLATSPAA